MSNTKTPNYIGPGEHSVRELEKMCSQFQQKISELNQQNRAYVKALKSFIDVDRSNDTEFHLCRIKAIQLIQNEGK